jgi:hypothetical protein
VVVRGHARATVVSAAAFAVALCVAAWVTARARERPESRLYERARAYADALTRGDAEEAASFAPGAALPHAVLAAELKGAAYRVEAVSSRVGDRRGEARLVFLGAPGAPRGRVLVLGWERSAGRPWDLRDVRPE